MDSSSKSDVKPEVDRLCSRLGGFRWLVLSKGLDFDFMTLAEFSFIARLIHSCASEIMFLVLRDLRRSIYESRFGYFLIELDFPEVLAPRNLQVVLSRSFDGIPLKFDRNAALFGVRRRNPEEIEEPFEERAFCRLF